MRTEYDERDMANAFDDARAKLIGDSTDRDWYDLWPRVTSARAELLRALEGVSEETAARRPGEGEGEATWSITEVVRHALTYTRNVRAIVEEVCTTGVSLIPSFLAARLKPVTAMSQVG